MPLLTDLPPEILYHILGYVDPPDLAWIPRTCKTLYHAVTANTPLFKQVYLSHLDAPPAGPVDWERCLKQLVQLRRLCERSDTDDKVRTKSRYANHGIVAWLDRSCCRVVRKSAPTLAYPHAPSRYRCRCFLRRRPGV